MEYKEEKAAVCSWKKIGTTKNRRKMNYFENKQRPKYQIQRGGSSRLVQEKSHKKSRKRKDRKTRKSPGMLGLKKVWAG